LSKVEDFDFSRMDDLDFDADSPVFGSHGQFVSPTTLVSGGSSSSTVQRIYPGMHSQAAQAKAQQAKQQQEMIRQQQQHQAARPMPAGQKPLPKGQPAKDPRVEESISRILNQMRQKSTSSDNKEEDSPSPNMSGLARSRKDEEDMDEDERLLASEEGKKLSSKERRQLRNKVSARAFRSRRKGMLQYNKICPLILTSLQNILASLKVKSPSRLTKTRFCVPRTNNCAKRTIASPISPACCSHRMPSLASFRSSASPVSLLSHNILPRRPTCKTALNNNRNSTSARTSTPLMPLVK
jgi:hypothetical protein